MVWIFWELTISYKKFTILSLQNITNFLVIERIRWHFILYRFPTFGSIWERYIKSNKFHLKRVIGESILTFKYFYMVLSSEKKKHSKFPFPLSLILWHRRFKPLDSSPFINWSFIICPAWRRYARDTQRFLTRWSKEYVSELQTKVKWVNWFKLFSWFLSIMKIYQVYVDNQDGLADSSLGKTEFVE